MENATAWTSPFAELLGEMWEELSPVDKAICLTYKRHLAKKLGISKNLIIRMGEIHERYMDFHVGCIP